MPDTIRKEDLLRHLTSEATETATPADQNFLDRVERMMNLADRILNSFANLKKNPMIRDFIARRIAQRGAAIMPEQPDPQPIPQEEPKPELPKPDAKPSALGITPEQMFNVIKASLEAILKDLGDLKISQVLARLEKDKDIVLKVIELRLEQAAKK